MDKDLINTILEGLFWLATAWLTVFMFLTIFGLASISGQMDEYKILQVGKLAVIGISVYTFIWLLRGVISKKWWY
jgi:hypothetical protein|tara:strand:- start:162 stop:386 length:225 start_codon:yes stop_codon:yes gene_type:complete